MPTLTVTFFLLLCMMDFESCWIEGPSCPPSPEASSPPSPPAAAAPAAARGSEAAAVPPACWLSSVMPHAGDSARTHEGFRCTRLECTRLSSKACSNDPKQDTDPQVCALYLWIYPPHDK